MKTFSKIAFALVIFLFCNTLNVKSQTSAVGYVGVSIVEAATATSSPITSFEIPTDRLAYQDRTSTETNYKGNQLDLGEIKLNSTSAVSCNMVLNPATLYDNNGNNMQVTLSARASDNIEGMCTKGSEVIKLNGNAQVGDTQVSGFYSGSYTVVFAFN